MEYKVFLVDDERWSLKDVRYTCPFEELGFDVIGESTSAVKALEEIRQGRPDVVFVDIRMPAMTGLDLIHLIKKDLPDTVFIILSGYAEFNYATEALRLGVFDYCLKPMEEQAARELLVRIRAHLDEKGRQQHEIERESVKESVGSANVQFSELLQYVNAHLTEPLALGDLAAQYHINVSYCGELFKSITGENFTQYVRNRRMKLACDLMLRTQLPLSQIAVRTGYADLPYFSRIFTQTMGTSPSRWRAENRAKGWR